MKKIGLWLLLYCWCASAAPCFDPLEFTAEKADLLRKSLPEELAAAKAVLADYRNFHSVPVAEARVMKRLEMADRLIGQIAGALRSADRDDVFFAARSMRSLKSLEQYLAEEKALAGIRKSAKEKVLSIRDFGAKGDGVADDSEAFRAAIAEAAGDSPVVIRLPKGRYLLNQVQKVEGRSCHLVFSGMKHVTLEGETPDTALIFGVSESTGIALVSCEDVTLRSLTMSSGTVPFFEMELESVDRGAKTLTGRHIAPSLPPDSPLIRDRGGLRQLFRKDGSLVTGDLWAKEKGCSVSASGKIQLSFSRGPFEKAEPGMRLVIPVRSDNSAVWFYRSRFCTAEKVTLHNSWGLGFANHIAYATTLSGCRIVPAPGLSFSTNADGFHSVSSGSLSGIGPALFDCEFRAMGDDPFNCYNKGWYLASARGKELLSLGGGGAAGDVLYTYSSAVGQVKAALEVAEETQGGVPWRETRVARTGIAEEIPASVATFDSLGVNPPTPAEQNAIYMAQLTMKLPDLIFNPFRAGAWPILSGCVFADNRNCGPVIQCDNALLENCTIENMESHAVKIGAFSTWREGPPPVNVLMRNCKIRNSGAVRTEFMVLGEKPGTLSPGRHIRNVTFENNEVADSRTSAFSIECASGVEFTGNRIVNPKKEAIAVGNAGNISCRGNLLDGKPFTAPGGELAWPVQCGISDAAREGNWQEAEGALKNSGSGFEALYAAPYSALKEVNLKTTFRFLAGRGKAGLRVVEHVGVPDNGWYFLLNGETGEFTVESRSRNKGEWKLNREILKKQLKLNKVNTMALESHFTRLSVSVNGAEVWRNGAPSPTLFHAGFAAFDTPVTVEALEIAGGGRRGGIVAFGDSITHHCRWQDALGKLAGMEIGNAGMAGDDTVNARKRLESDVIALRPELVLILLGTNNASAEQAMEDLKFITGRLREEKINFVVCTILPRPQPERAVRINEFLRRYCKEQKIPLHDWFGALSDGSGRMKAEYGGGVHPNEKGVEVMARSFFSDPQVNQFIIKGAGK